jgi:thiopeptide-type bacteriocin biosynthesis protein
MMNNENRSKMMNESVIDETWLAAYLYYAEPWEEFLIRGVQPFIRSVMEKKQADRFFFIRYWERGPHIRLRFKGDPGQMDVDIKPRLESHFYDYFKQNPSKREDPEYVRNLPEEHRWFPNNTVQYIPYEPEVERYGGPTGIIIAEKQFQVSADAVLAIIEESDHWDYDRALGAAIQMHLGFAFALGMDLTETTAFYSHISRMWFARSYGYEENIPEEELKKRQDITWKAFKENFDKQKAVLVPYHETLWEAFTGGVEFEQEWLNRWVTGMGVIRDQLKKAHTDGTLIIPKWFKLQPVENVPEPHRQLWAILESYVHMTNNRLGILNRDEAYLGYLIRESLSSVGSRQ